MKEKLTSTFLLCLALLFLSGCETTPYKPAENTDGFGYRDKKIQDNTYQISIKVIPGPGNKQTAHKVGLEYWRKRAAQLCNNNLFEEKIRYADIKRNYTGAITSVSIDGLASCSAQAEKTQTPLY